MTIVEWRGIYRIVDDRTGLVLAVCETLAEADYWLAAQEEPEP